MIITGLLSDKASAAVIRVSSCSLETQARKEIGVRLTFFIIPMIFLKERPVSLYKYSGTFVLFFVDYLYAACGASS